MKKLILLSAGAAAGFVLGARAGRPAYDRIREGWNGLTRSAGLDNLASTAKEAAIDVRNVATERASDAMAKGADDLSQRIDTLVPSRAGTGRTDEPDHPIGTSP